jgi:large subunit ribosomal protein L4e
MFAPTKVWRKWHQKINLNQKRFATASALAASACPPLVMARGHKIETVPEVPLVVNSEIFANAGVAKTSSALKLLESVGAGADVSKVKASRKLRAGKGKLRGRRHRQRRGPLVVFDPEVDGKELAYAFRNIAGVETCSVRALNLLQLAPGGHMGRFVIWTSASFKALDSIFSAPTAQVAQADIGRLINSSEIQTVIRAAKGDARTKRAGVQKKNPLQNKQVLLRLNPYAAAYSKEKIGTQGVEHSKPAGPSEVFSKTLMTE